MSIDRSEVLRIAALARLRLPDDEAGRLAADLQKIVEHIDRLAGVELRGDEDALTYFDADVHREDRSAECLALDQALQNAPETDGEYFLVPKVVDKDEGGDA